MNYFRERNLEYVNVGGAGECLYRVFAYHLYANIDRWPEIKQVEIDFLGRQTIPLVDNIPRQDYIEMIRPREYYGTDLDAYILAKIFKLRVFLYKVVDGEIINKDQITIDFGDRVFLDQSLGFESFNSFPEIIRIVNMPQEHYDVVVDPLKLGKKIFPQVETKEDGILFLKFYDFAK